MPSARATDQAFRRRQIIKASLAGGGLVAAALLVAWSLGAFASPPGAKESPESRRQREERFEAQEREDAAKAAANDSRPRTTGGE